MMNVGEEREIPGSVANPDREFLYLSFVGEVEFIHLIEQIIRDDLIDRPKGGLIFVGCEITTPEGEKFLGVTYKDKVTWRGRLLDYAERTAMASAEISNGHFALSNGKTFPMSGCSVRFYDSPTIKRKR